MVVQRLTSFAVRPRLGLMILVSLAVVFMALGCNHRRSALRPVYVTPAPACSTPGCSTPAVVPGVVAPAPGATLMPSGVEPSLPSQVEPSPSSLGAPVEAAPSAGPAPANTPPTPMPPSPGTERLPSAAPGPAEPGLLEPVPPNNSNSNSNGIGSGSGTSGNPPPQTPSLLTVPRLQAPGTSLNGGRGAAPPRPPRVSLRERLLPYTNNPDDLFSPPKADRPWKYVVLHHSANPSGSYGEIDREHRKRLGWDGCGYHFVIGNGTGSPDGRIEVASRWSNQKQGVHCRNGKNADVSEYSIGVCLVGNLDDAPPTPRQIAATQALVAYLGARYNIPSDRVGTHALLANTPTACPGRHFPIQAILGSNSHLVQR